MLCRKNQATLTAQEKARFVAAVLALKANGTYDEYVTDHRDHSHGAHRGPAFLPWHREFLRRFELDLQDIDSGVTLPYWDWSVDNSALSTLWNSDFMGGDGRLTDGRVMTGPFAFDAGNWPLNVLPGGERDPFLKREFGQDPLAPSLPTRADVDAALRDSDYDVSPWNTTSRSGFRNRLEGWIAGPQLHNRVHVWVGGSMLPMTSPNDPVFFLHHCYVDKLWADWQAKYPNKTYVPVAGAPAGHNLTDRMEPWAGRGEIVTPANVLDHNALGYAYDTEPECKTKLEFKEGKREKLEFKEALVEIKKREKLEKFEKSELKERKPEKFEMEKPPRLEGKGIRELPGELIREDLPAAPPAERLARMENAIGELTHFISANLRPDLSLGALSGEQDISEADMERLRREQAQAKANADIGKMHEH